MSEIASKGQLRMSFLRWAFVTVPAVLLLGLLSGSMASTGSDNLWYAALQKPTGTPPNWVFPVAWTSIYILIGLALAVVLNARGARLRGPAVALFIVQMLLNIAWMPLFFGAHQVFWALVLIWTLFALALVTTFLFGRIRSLAAWLMVPYLVWLSYAGMLTIGIDRLNPNATTLVPPGATTQIPL